MVSLFSSAVPSKISRDSNSQVPIGLISAQAPIIMSVMEGQIWSRSLYFKWCRRCWRLSTPMAVDIYRSFLAQVFVVILKWLKCMIFASLPSKHHARIQRWCCLHPKHDTIWHMSVIIDRAGEHLALWVTVIMHACRINAEQHHHKHCGVSTLSVKLFEELQQNCVCFIVLSEECWSFLFAQRLGTIWETWPLFVAGGF